jgi:hypothetical protein
MIAGETKEPALIAALVRAPDGVRFAATGGWASDVVPALAHYVGHRCQNVLWPSAAAEVRLLIDAGRPSRAIAVYFEHVGARWDEECLELYVVAPERSSAVSVSDRQLSLATELAQPRRARRHARERGDAA